MFKVTRTYTIPADAERRTHKGENQARVKIDGKMVWAPVNAKGRVLVQSPHWHARVGGRVVKLARDKAAAEIKLNGLRVHHEKVEAGLALPLANTTQPMPELVKEFAASLKLAGKKPATYERIPVVLNKLLAAIQVKSLKDLRKLDGTTIEKWATNQTGAAATTRYILDRLKSFLNWLHGRRLIGLVPPFPKVTGPATKVKALLTPELEAKLLAAIPVRRQLLYRFMISTGARCGAAAALLAGDLDLDRASGPVAVLRAEKQKNGSGLSVPLTRALADDLRHLAKDMAATDSLFGFLNGNLISRRFAADLKKAKINPKQPDGVLCAHSLRHSFATRMLRAGVSPALVAQVGNWKTLQVLMKNYSHLIANDGRSGVENVFGG